MAILMFFAAALALVSAAPSRQMIRGVTPQVKGTPQNLGFVTDPNLNRDSCGSTKFSDRTLWACRDTQHFKPDGSVEEAVFSTSASWTNYNQDGSPQLFGSSLGMYGNNHDTPFYKYNPEDCGDSPAGGCPDGTRYAIWPDAPPMVAKNESGVITAYTWIRRSHIKNDLSTVDADPATTLYKVTYDPSKNDPARLDILPTVDIVKAAFWAEGEIPYGAYGNVVKDGTAYLYGQPSSGTVSLAKVPADSVEDQSKYQYWVNGAWTSSKPARTDSSSSIGIDNSSSGGQGTYYYSDAWNSYVWIGGSKFPTADFSITTAPAPEGPWQQPKEFYKGENGNFSLGAYSLQAHPSLVPAGKNEIYLTYTKNDVSNSVSYYSTPLILVEWQ